MRRPSPPPEWEGDLDEEEEEEEEGEEEMDFRRQQGEVSLDLKMRKWEVHPFKEESRSNFPHSSSRDTLGIAQLVTWVAWDGSSVMEEIDIQNVK